MISITANNCLEFQKAKSKSRQDQEYKHCSTEVTQLLTLQQPEMKLHNRGSLEDSSHGEVEYWNTEKDSFSIMKLPTTGETTIFMLIKW